MANRRGVYRMTPARRAALHRAQLISAQKRKGSHGSRIKGFAKNAGLVGGAIGATFIAHHTNEYIVHPHKVVQHSRTAGKTTAKLATATARRIKRGGNQKPPTVVPKNVSRAYKFHGGHRGTLL